MRRYVESERHALQRIFCYAGQSHEPASFRICAGKNMLAIVEYLVSVIDASRATAEDFRRFVNAGADSRFSESHRRRHARVTAADDGNLPKCIAGIDWGVSHAATHVRHAIHSFRMGVSEVR